jgi:hypothetical protein
VKEGGAGLEKEIGGFKNFYNLFLKKNTPKLGRGEKGVPWAQKRGLFFICSPGGKKGKSPRKGVGGFSSGGLGFVPPKEIKKGGEQMGGPKKGGGP